MRFHFRASIKPFFENHVFRAVLGPFHPLHETKISNRSLSVVYGSITLKFFFGGSGNMSAPVVQPTKRNSKTVFFWDTLRNSLLIFALFFIHVFGTYLSAKYFSYKIFKEGISLIRQYFRNCPNGLSVGFFYKMEYEVSEAANSEWKNLVAHFEVILFAQYA